MVSVINCDLSEIIGLVEKILILISILNIFPKFYLDLVLNWKSHSLTCLDITYNSIHFPLLLF
jgi:hypothetical protein